MKSTAALMLSFLLIAALAGCVTNAPKDDIPEPTPQAKGLPLAVLWCADTLNRTKCNQEMTPDEGRQGNEVTIAVNPTNPKNIVGGAKDYYPMDAGECVWDGVYVTTDGGRTYEDRSFDGSPWRALADPTSFKPNYASQFWCTTDPVAYFNTKGTFYYLLMAYQADRVTGSKTCKDTCPNGALNDWAFNRAVQIVAISDDGGKTFHTFTPVLEGSYPVAFHDKGWIAASADGTIHVMWLSFVLGNMYFRSTDGGRTFSDPQLLAPYFGPAGQGSFVDVGTGKEVYATWVDGGAIQLRRSFDDGATWDAQRAVLGKHSAGMPGLSPRDRRGGYPSMATDRFPDSPYANALYFTWQDSCQSKNWSQNCASGAPNVYFSASFDKGTTFSTPIRLNDDIDEYDNSHKAVYHIFPTVSVSPGGVIDVSWMDTRLDSEGYRLDQYYTYSLDGGKTWAKNMRVRDADDNGWDPALSHHQNGMVFIGDYNDIDSSWGSAHPVWPDTRSGKVVDVYTAVIQRPLFAEGWDATKRAETLARLVKDGLVDADHPFLEYAGP